MSNIIEASQLPEQDKVFMKKDYFGWRVVNPNKNPDGSINWINLLVGGWRNFIFLLILLALIGFNMYSYNHDVQAIQENYRVIASDPIGWCHEICANPQKTYDIPQIDFINDKG